MELAMNMRLLKEFRNVFVLETTSRFQTKKKIQNSISSIEYPEVRHTLESLATNVVCSPADVRVYFPGWGKFIQNTGTLKRRSIEVHQGCVGGDVRRVMQVPSECQNVSSKKCWINDDQWDFIELSCFIWFGWRFQAFLLCSSLLGWMVPFDELLQQGASKRWFYHTVRE